MSDCPHPDVEASVEVARIVPDEETDTPTAFSASIRVRCLACSEPFVWLGAPVGLDPRSPRVSVDAQELRAPLRPASAPAGFGEDGPGFTVTAEPQPASSSLDLCTDLACRAPGLWHFRSGGCHR